MKNVNETSSAILVLDEKNNVLDAFYCAGSYTMLTGEDEACVFVSVTKHSAPDEPTDFDLGEYKVKVRKNGDLFISYRAE